LSYDIREKQTQKVEVQLEDDLTGGPADETVMFGVDGRDYQVSLNAEHAASAILTLTSIRNSPGRIQVRQMLCHRMA
jgi:nucleoid-associated protein Lsr2